jgi:hypothetical protein
MGSYDSPAGEIDVKLDGVPIEMPPERRSFSAIRAFLERLALGQHRILCWVSVDGESVPLAQPGGLVKDFTLLEGETMSLNEVPAHLIKGALHQTAAVRARVQKAVELVLINNGRTARDLWWELATALKEPLLTLSLVPDTICRPARGRASLVQLRKWQLQQLGCVIQDVDDVGLREDPARLAEALEKRVLPWLDNLQESLELWYETAASSPHKSHSYSREARMNTESENTQ